MTGDGYLVITSVVGRDVRASSILPRLLSPWLPQTVPDSLLGDHQRLIVYWAKMKAAFAVCWAVMKMWKLSHTDVCDCGERQTMCHLMSCGDAPDRTWADLAMPTLADINCAKLWEESICR